MRFSVAVLGTILMSSPALAGPCTDDIAQVGRQLSGSPALGPVTTGTLSGSNPGTAGQVSAADRTGTTASGNGAVGGTAGTKELNAASANVATSPDDVRRQQAGQPTAAQQAGAGHSVETAPGAAGHGSAASDRQAAAKVDWQQAVDLNAKNDPACKGAIDRARDALKSG